MKTVRKAALTEVTCRCVQGQTSVPAVSSGGAWGTNNGNTFDSVPATIAVDREAGVSFLDQSWCTCCTDHASAKPLLRVHTQVFPYSNQGYSGCSQS